LRIETTKRLAAQRQVDAALGRLHKSELEAAIALAAATEGLLPGAAVDEVTTSRRAPFTFSGRRRRNGSLDPGQRRLQRRLFGVIE
jgi:hypothetical protein